MYQPFEYSSCLASSLPSAHFSASEATDLMSKAVGARYAGVPCLTTCCPPPPTMHMSHAGAPGPQGPQQHGVQDGDLRQRLQAPDRWVQWKLVQARTGSSAGWSSLPTRVVKCTAGVQRTKVPRETACRAVFAFSCVRRMQLIHRQGQCKCSRFAVYRRQGRSVETESARAHSSFCGEATPWSYFLVVLTNTHLLIARRQGRELRVPGYGVRVSTGGSWGVPSVLAHECVTFETRILGSRLCWSPRSGGPYG